MPVTRPRSAAVLMSRAIAIPPTLMQVQPSPQAIRASRKGQKP